MKPQIKYLLQTLSYYGIVAIVTYIFHLIAPSDMCNPGLDVIFLIFIAPLITLVLLVRNVYQFFKGKKEYSYSLIAHTLVVILFVVFIVFKIYMEGRVVNNSV